MPRKPKKDPVDRLGEIKAEIANLQQEYNKIVDELAEECCDEIVGNLFKVRFTEVCRRTVNYKYIATQLYDIPESVFEDNATYHDSMRVTVSARTQDDD